ncbi:MAG TPA: pitrilysin family protein [Bryobacteraceae bacterium]|nr:pitrilysin family protein [Bryobacteraceae bacterium]
MKLLPFRSLILLSLAAAAWSAETQSKIFPYQYTQEDLPNGLRVVTVPTDFPNIVSLFIVVQAGSRNEVEPGHTGFAHLFEHMMFRGTEKFPPEKVEQTLQKAGAASNAYTSADLTAYHITFSREDLETMLMMEADRFQNLKYPENVFRTETLAVLGEYNKNSANPISKLFEVLQDTAFDRHTYKHTTMGFLKDIQDMPNQYEYSLKFFNRYYRPEYTTIVVAGDVKPGQVRPLVDKYWGKWQRGGYKAEIPVEPPQQGPRAAHVDWPTATLPWVAVAYKAPAYTDTEPDSAALDALAFLGFSSTSDLYQKLVVREQRVDDLDTYNPDSVDPFLFTVLARIKKADDVHYVRDQVLETMKNLRDKPVPKERLDAVKNHLRYSFSLRMDNSEAVAGAVARYVALRRTPETIDRLYARYAALTPDDIQRAARKYLIDEGCTIVTLTGGAK